MKICVFFFITFASCCLSAQTFVEYMDSSLEGVHNGSIAFADIDGDFDMDLIILGRKARVSDPSTTLYINDGSGNFTAVMDTPFPPLMEGKVAFADVDDDNDQDLFLTGSTESNEIAKLYLNDGSGNFQEAIFPRSSGITNGAMAFADVNNDNAPDLLLTGYDGGFDLVTDLYLNNGAGRFTKQRNSPFLRVIQGDVAFADIDGDKDMDVLIMGENINFQPSANLYTNDGNGNFSEVKNIPFEGSRFCSIAFADIDSDDDQDLIITEKGFMEPSTKLYVNDGKGNFTERLNTPFEQVRRSTVAFVDVDGDNDQDLIITGMGESILVTTLVTNLYLNDGAGNFSEVPNSGFLGSNSGDLAVADVDGDKSPDVLITGDSPIDGPNSGVMPSARLYLNQNVITSLSSQSFTSKGKVIIYPNPTKPQTIFIQYKSEKSNRFHISILDIIGRPILKYNNIYIHNGEEAALDVSTINSGIYLVRITDGSDYFTETLVIH